MASYLSSWFFGTAAPAPPPIAAPELNFEAPSPPASPTEEDYDDLPPKTQIKSSPFKAPTKAPNGLANGLNPTLSATGVAPNPSFGGQRKLEVGITIDDGLDDDTPPAFPALNSIQRSGGGDAAGTSLNPPSTSRPAAQSARTNSALTDAQRMPPPPPPSFTISSSRPNASLTPSLNAPSATTNSLTPPRFPATSSLSAPRASSSSGPSLSVPLSTTSAPGKLPGLSADDPEQVRKKQKQSRKVALAPGHSTLDWAMLKNSGKDLRGGVTGLIRVTPSMLKQHNTASDAWTAIEGKVYNIGPYFDFHPGGVKDLMRVAGRDGTKLFALTHGWVNAEMMLDNCMVGFLVPE